jgi:uncharacterized protein (DUF697 family)
MATEIARLRPTEEELDALVRNYSLLASGEILVIVVPGADVAAVLLTWARMIQQIGRAYGREISREDARNLAWTFLTHGLSVGGAWFGSAMLAQMILKAIPVGGTVAAYLIDATVAAASIGRITRDLAETTCRYFEADMAEPAKKKIHMWDKTLGRVVSAAQSVAVIVGGLKRPRP